MWPSELRISCTVERADGTSEEVLEGDGSITPHHRFGVSRVIEFDAVAGTTNVTCIDRLSPSANGGRFQIVESGGIKQIGLIAGALIALLGVVSLVTTVLKRVRRGRNAA